MGVKKKAFDNNEISRFIPLGTLPPASLQEAVRATVIEEILPGQYLFRVGDDDTQALYLLQGELELVVEKEVVETIVAGSHEARCPIAPRKPRQVSARAKTAVLIARIDAHLLDQLSSWGESGGYEVADIGSQGNEDWISRLLKSEVFQRLPPSKIQQVLSHVRPVPVKAGDVIIRQGDDGDYFYIVKSGRCVVSRQPSPEGKAVRLAELDEGDSFGEEALLADAKRNATVTMVTHGCLMRLAKQDFVEFLQEPVVTGVDFAEALSLVQAGGTWLDVRPADQFNKGALADSINLPLPLVRDRARELHREGQYILCCDNGRLSANAAFLLSQMGFAVRVLCRGLKDVPAAALTQQASQSSGLGSVGAGVSPLGNHKIEDRQEHIPTASNGSDDEVATQIAQAETAALYAKIRAVRAGHEQAVDKINQRVALLETALEQVQAQEQTAIQDRHRSEAKRRILEQKLEAAHLDSEQQAQKFDLAQLESQDLRQQLQALTRHMEADQADYEQQLAETLKAGQEDNTILQQQRDEACTELEAAKARLSGNDTSYQNEKTRAAALEQQLVRVNQELAEQQGHLTEERAAKQRVREQVDAEAALAADLSTQLADLDRIRSSETAEAQLREAALLAQLEAATKRDLEKIAELEATRDQEAEQNQQQLTVLAEELAAVAEKLAAAESREQELKVLSAQLQKEQVAARSDAVQMSEELDHLREEVQETGSQEAEEHDELMKARQELAEQLQEKECEYKRRQSEWHAQLEAVQQQCQSLEEDCDRLREQKETVCLQVEQQTQELENLRQRGEAMDTEGMGDFFVLRERLEIAEEQARTAIKENENWAEEHRSLQIEIGLRRDQEAALRMELDAEKEHKVKLTAQLRELSEQSGVELSDSDRDNAGRVEEQLQEQIEQLQAELTATKDTLVVSDCDSQLREQVLQIELDEMLSQADSELKEVTQRLEEAQEQLEHVHNEAPAQQEQTDASGTNNNAATTHEDPIDNIRKLYAESSRQGRPFGYIVSQITTWLRRSGNSFLPRAAVLVVSVGLVASFILQAEKTTTILEPVAPTPENQAMLSHDKALPAPDSANKSATKTEFPTAQIESTKDAIIGLRLGLSEFMDTAATYLGDLREYFTNQSIKMQLELERTDAKHEVATTAKSAEATSIPPKALNARAVPVTRGYDFQDKYSDGSDGPVMVRLPRGQFNMGSRDSSPFFDERPQHSVRIRGFAIGKYEVTFAEYDRFTEFAGQQLPGTREQERGDLPVVNVSWDDAVAYTQWLSQQTGRRYRLPTEAEWEYAARAGTNSPHWWDKLKPMANCFDCDSPWAGIKVAPVGYFHANPFGLHDTAGNAAEWVQDCYYTNYAGAHADGRARVEPTCDQRVVRGGSYASPLNSIRSTKRSSEPPNSQIDTLGFRVVREL